MSPEQYCRERATAAGSSLHYAFLFLPPAQRSAVTALCALRREVGEVVEECNDLQLAQTKLAWWRNELACLFAGKPQHPVTRALEPALQPYAITEERLGEVIAAMEMDLAQTRYPDFNALEHYCHHASGALGVLAAGVFGYTDARTLAYARELGTALQLTRIIRDTGKDARRNRVYVPLDELAAHGIGTDDILQARHGDAFVALMRYQAARARSRLRLALAVLPAADRRAQQPGLIMAAICLALLDEIERDGFKVLTQRTSLTPLRKLWLASKTWLTT